MTDEQLRSAWARLRSEPARQPCPASEAIFDAVSGRGTLAEREAIIDHMRLCGPCSEAWRIAAEVSGEAVDASAQPGTSPMPSQAKRVRSWWFGGVATGLALAASILLFVGLNQPKEDPWRDASAGVEVVATVAPRTELPRAAFLLSWRGGGENDRFIVHLFDSGLTPLHDSTPLSTHEFTVPESVIVKLAPGSTVYWQVESIAPDGTRNRSATFDVRLK